MSRIKRINHVAIAVEDLDSALGFWRDTLGMELTHIEEVKGQQSLVAFLPTGDSEIELVKPTSEDTGLARFLQKRGPGFHHVCFEVENLVTTLERLKQTGIQLINEEPAVGAGGARMAFIHPSSAYGVLVELYETRQPPNKPFPTLHSKRVLLRPFELSDKQALFNLYSNNEARRFLQSESMDSIDEAAKQLNKHMQAYEQGTGVRWGVVLKNSGQLIGSCGYHFSRQNTPVVELGYELHPNFWHQGLMTESLIQVLNYVFSPDCEPYIHRVEVLIVPDNRTSIRLVEKLGFQKEATLKESGYWERQHHDLYLYAIVQGQWAPPHD